jgi:hypothetical protein
MDERGQVLVLVIVGLVVMTATFGVVLQLAYA